MKLAAVATERPQIALEQSMGVEADAVAIDDAVGRVVLEQRTERVHSPGIEPLQFRELADLGLERVQTCTLFLASVDKDGHSAAERHVGEALRRHLEEASARQGQRADEPVAERVMDHRRAPAGRVEADLLLGLEHSHARALRELGRRGKAGDPAADHEDVAGLDHAQAAAVSRSFTTLPPWVRRMPLTISSSSGSTGAPF